MSSPSLPGTVTSLRRPSTAPSNCLWLPVRRSNLNPCCSRMRMTSRTFTVVPDPHRPVQYVSNVLSGKTLVPGRAGDEAYAPRTWVQHACFNPRGAPSAATKRTVDVFFSLCTLFPRNLRSVWSVAARRTQCNSPSGSRKVGSSHVRPTSGRYRSRLVSTTNCMSNSDSATALAAPAERRAFLASGGIWTR